jgi:DNA-3-methyladenine glycosylase
MPPSSSPDPAPGALLPASFFARDALDVARDLVGVILRHGPVAVRITEVEAYRWPDDSANHCHRGPTARNAPMWGPPGRAYLYRCYGIHTMLNLVTGPEGEGAAVLIRSAEPVEGIETLQARRHGLRGPALLAGPGRLAAALGLDLSFNHHPVTEPGGLETRVGRPPARLAVGPRVGIDYAEPRHIAAPWRLADADSRWVSERRNLRSDP